MYRWTFRTVIPNIGLMFYSLKRGIKNCIKWIPVIWNDEDFDWEYLAKIMEFKMSNMSYFMKNYGCAIDSEKAAIELLECTELLKRLRLDNNIELLCYRTHLDRMKGWNERLGYIIGKKLRCWWD